MPFDTKGIKDGKMMKNNKCTIITNLQIITLGETV